MNQREFAYIVMALKAAYKHFSDMDKSQVQIWYEMLQDIDYKLAETAVKKYILTNKFPPTIADIRETVSTTVNKETSAIDAWGEVLKSIQKYGYYNMEQALESLSPKTKTVAQKMGYRELCLSENQMADRAHFIKMYDSFVNREKKNEMLPEGFRKQIEQIGSETKFIGG